MPSWSLFDGLNMFEQVGIMDESTIYADIESIFCEMLVVEWNPMDIYKPISYGPA